MSDFRPTRLWDSHPLLPQRPDLPSQISLLDLTGVAMLLHNEQQAAGVRADDPLLQAPPHQHLHNRLLAENQSVRADLVAHLGDRAVAALLALLADTLYPLPLPAPPTELAQLEAEPLERCPICHELGRYQPPSPTYGAMMVHEATQEQDGAVFIHRHCVVPARPTWTPAHTMPSAALLAVLQAETCRACGSTGVFYQAPQPGEWAAVLHLVKGDRTGTLAIRSYCLSERRPWWTLPPGVM